MLQTTRFLLLVQGITFVLGALAHSGLVLANYTDPAAAIAETVIAAVLLGALALTWRMPARTRTLALGAQGFALLGTLVGVTLVLVVGPTKVLDLTLHSIMLVELIAGLVITARQPAQNARAYR